MNWAELIKKLRNKLLITQMELGEMLGVSFSTVNRWEMGCHEPTMKLKRKIAELCKKMALKWRINMDQLFSITPLKVNQLISKIETGELGLPELQRPFIWEDAKVRDLFDSMMKGYPIGYLMVWECPELEKKKLIGVGEHNYPEPKEVIIDGQQRLTSLFAVIKGKKVYDKKYNEREIIISFNPLTCVFEVGYQATLKDKQWIYNISDAYTSPQYAFINSFIRSLEKYRASKGQELTNVEKDLIAANITALYNLQSYDLPVFSIKAEADEESVSNIFVRVNSGDVKLKQNDFILTLLSLYWTAGRKYIEEFAIQSTKPSEKPSSYNVLVEVEPQDIIRVVVAYAFDRARLKYAYKLLRGANFEKKGAIDIDLRNQRFDVLKDKLADVLDVHTWHEFLKAVMNAGYLGKEQLLASTNIFYSYAFYLIAKHRFKASYNENMRITSKWVFYANLVSLYTGSFESLMEQHLNALKEVKDFEGYKEFINQYPF